MTVVDLGYRDSPRHAGGSSACRPLTLTEKHGQLLWQLAVRAGERPAAVEAGRWRARELEALLGYLRAEIMGQAADEETLLFPAHRDTPGMDRLVRARARPRAGVEALEQAVAGYRGSPAMLAATAGDHPSQLETHLSAEERSWSPGGSRHEPG